MQRRSAFAMAGLLSARPTTTTTPAPLPAAPPHSALPPNGPDANLLVLEIVGELIGVVSILDDFLTERLRERQGIVKEHLGSRTDHEDGVTERQLDEWEWEDNRLMLGRLFRLHGLVELVSGERRPQVHDELPPPEAWAKDRVGALREYICSDNEKWRTGRDPLAR